MASRDLRSGTPATDGDAGHTVPDGRTDHVDISIVIPTIGRASLGATLRSLVEAAPDQRITLHEVVLVDDRHPDDWRDPVNPPPSTGELRAIANAWLGDVDADVAITRSEGSGPAGSRNLGIACTATPWVVVLDDDVVVSDQWWHALADDLLQADAEVGVVFARVDVSLPDRRRAIREPDTTRLATARWITADAALRRAAFEQAGGFDEGVDCASQEADDLALRLLDTGWRLDTGSRRSTRPRRTPKRRPGRPRGHLSEPSPE